MAFPELRMPKPPASAGRSDGIFADETTALLGNHTSTKTATSLRRHHAVALAAAGLGFTAVVGMVLAAVWWVGVFGGDGEVCFLAVFFLLS